MQNDLCRLKGFLDQMQGKRLLHISDTPTALYPAVARILELVQPDILIHTGDLADEYKVGRIPEHLPGYRHAVTELINLMQKHAKTIWITHGNNDDARWLEEIPSLFIWPMTGSSHKYGKLRLYLQHQPVGWLDDSVYDFALYGHGFTNDFHDPAANHFGQLCYFNGMRAASLIDSESKEYFQVSYCHKL